MTLPAADTRATTPPSDDVLRRARTHEFIDNALAATLATALEKARKTAADPIACHANSAGMVDLEAKWLRLILRDYDRALAALATHEAGARERVAAELTYADTFSASEALGFLCGSVRNNLPWNENHDRAREKLRAAIRALPPGDVQGGAK